jgi:hypothetical protein
VTPLHSPLESRAHAPRRRPSSLPLLHHLSAHAELPVLMAGVTLQTPPVTGHPGIFPAYRYCPRARGMPTALAGGLTLNASPAQPLSAPTEGTYFSASPTRPPLHLWPGVLFLCLTCSADGFLWRFSFLPSRPVSRGAYIVLCL